MSEPTSPLAVDVVDGIVYLIGEIDAATVADVDVALSNSALPVPVTVDLSGVEFIDSTGLRVLLDAHQQRLAAGEALHFVNVSRAARRLFEIAGVHEYLVIVD